MNLPNTTFLAYTQDTYDITKQQGNLKRSITYDVLRNTYGEFSHKGVLGFFEDCAF